MSPDQLLQRLFDCVRRIPEAEDPEMPYGLETAVIAQWKDAVTERAAGIGLVRSLRWAALTACAVALLAGFLGSEELAAFKQRNELEARLADSAIAAAYDNE